MPGVVVGVEAISNRASQLPHIGLDAPKRLVGTNTIDCMKSGVLYGTASMLDGMIDRYKAELGEDLTVIATGAVDRFFRTSCTVCPPPKKSSNNDCPRGEVCITICATAFRLNCSMCNCPACCG